MPIIVDPNIPDPPPPLVVSSPDGRLTATIDPEGAGVLLEAEFTSDIARSDTFDAGIDGWSAFANNGPAPDVSCSWDEPNGRIMLDWRPTGVTSYSSVGAEWALPEPLPGGRTYVFRFVLNGPAGKSDYARVSLLSTAGAGFSATVASPAGRTYYLDGTDVVVPEGHTLDRARVYLGGNVQPSYVAIEQVAITEKLPDEVRFLRDGKPVASGHDATAVDGHAIAYDRFAPIGVASRWQAIPIYASGRIGEPTDVVSATVPDTGCPTYNTWVKSVDDPAASVQLIAIEPLPVFTRTARTQLSAVVNHRNRAGSWDVHLGWETTLTFMTQDSISQKQVERLLTSGPLLLQMTRRFNIDEMFVLPGDVEMAPHRNMVTGQHVWTVPISQIAEPSTLDAGLYIPGKSYDEIGAQVANYNEAQTLWPTYDDVLGLAP